MEYTASGCFLSGLMGTFLPMHKRFPAVLEKPCWKITVWCQSPLLERSHMPLLFCGQKYLWGRGALLYNSHQSFHRPAQSRPRWRVCSHVLLACPFSSTLWWQTVYSRIRPCISYKVKIFIFVYYGNKILFTYQLSQRMMTFFILLNAGITWRTIDAASSSLDSFFCHIRYPSGMLR